MLAAYRQLEKHVGAEVSVNFCGGTYRGMLSGVYTILSVPMLVLVSPNGQSALEHHIPLAQAAVTFKTEQ